MTSSPWDFPGSLNNRLNKMAQAQGKSSKKSLGTRKSCKGNKKFHPMSPQKFLQLFQQGGTFKVQNDQIAKAIIQAAVSSKSNPTTVNLIVNNL